MGDIMQNSGKETVLVVIGPGGHMTETLNLIDSLGDKFSYDYVTQREDPLIRKKLKRQGRVFSVNSTRGHLEFRLISVFRTLRTFWQALGILRKTKAKAIISSGPGIALPFCYLAKLFGKKVIFIETFSRVHSKSLTGKLIYPVADLFFVQWEPLKAKYPRAIFAGRLE